MWRRQSWPSIGVDGLGIRQNAVANVPAQAFRGHQVRLPAQDPAQFLFHRR
jgi:hypothetical protein